jgi:hypothetical protein
MRVIAALFLSADIALLFIVIKADLKERRRQRAEHELELARQRLTALGLRHTAGLNELAFEARKALIMESFRASQEAQRTTR